MRSRTPKLLHRAAGRTLLEWITSAVAEAGAEAGVAVVRAGGGDVAEGVPGWVRTAEQAVPLGTGDAARSAGPALAGFEGDVLVLNGDHPLTDPATLRELVDAHRAAGAAASVLTFTRTAAIGGDFGRVVADGDQVARIVEVRDAGPAERALTEVSSGIFVFRSAALWPALGRLSADNDQGELYLPDVVAALRLEGERVI